MQGAPEEPQIVVEAVEAVEDDDGQQVGPSAREKEDAPSAQKVNF